MVALCNGFNDEGGPGEHCDKHKHNCLQAQRTRLVLAPTPGGCAVTINFVTPSSAIFLKCLPPFLICSFPHLVYTMNKSLSCFLSRRRWVDAGRASSLSSRNACQAQSLHLRWRSVCVSVEHLVALEKVEPTLMCQGMSPEFVLGYKWETQVASLVRAASLLRVR